MWGEKYNPLCGVIEREDERVRKTKARPAMQSNATQEHRPDNYICPQHYIYLHLALDVLEQVDNTVRVTPAMIQKMEGRRRKNDGMLEQTK